MDEPRIISNQVFKEIQTPTIIPTTTSSIIYANEYSGLDYKSMPKEYASVLNSDIGETGNNLLVQLKQKVQALPNGPWYVDSRDGVIYIHNRVMQEPVVRDYTYQAENGELLSIDFQTQYVTRYLDGSVSMGIGGNKELDITTDVDDMASGYSYAGETPEERNAGSYKAYQDYMEGKLPYEQLEIALKVNNNKLPDNLRGNVETKRHKELATSHSISESSKKEEVREKYNTYKAHGGRAAGNYRVTNKNGYRGAVSNQGNDYLIKQWLSEEANPDQLKHEVERILIQVSQGLEGGAEELRKRFALAAKNHQLDEFLKANFGAAKHIFDESDTGLMPEAYGEYVVDTRAYSTMPEKVSQNELFRGNMDQKTYDVKRARDGYSRLKNDPSVIVTGDLNGFRTTVFIKKKRRVMVSQYQVLQAYFTRMYGSGNSSSIEDVEARMNLLNNQRRKITERKLVCRMTIVGNPSLTTSQILNIQNVGKRWSGAWYIKAVTHQLEGSSGYTCLVELVKHNGRSPSISSNATASLDGSTNTEGSSIKTKTNKTQGTSGFVPTRMDAIYYTALGDKKSATQSRMDFVILSTAAANGEFGEDVRKTGVLMNTGVTSTSSYGSKVSYSIKPGIKITAELRRKYAKEALKAEESLKKMSRNIESNR